MVFLPALPKRASRAHSNVLDGTEDDALWEGGDCGRNGDSQMSLSISDSASTARDRV